MFNLLHLIKSVLSNDASATRRPLLEPISVIRDQAQPIGSAIVTQAIILGDKGQVKFQGSWWTARCNSGVILLPGETVQVLYRQNLTLYVEPLSSPTMFLQQTALSSY